MLWCLGIFLFCLLADYCSIAANVSASLLAKLVSGNWDG